MEEGQRSAAALKYTLHRLRSALHPPPAWLQSGRRRSRLQDQMFRMFGEQMLQAGREESDINHRV